MSSFYERILYEIRDRQAFYERKILPGNLTPEEYKSFCGRLQGIQETEEIIKNAYKAIFENSIMDKE